MSKVVILYQPRIDFEPHYPCYWAPLSVLSVAAVLLPLGVRVIILDGNLGNNRRDEIILRDNISECVCVGISSMIGGKQLERALKFARFAKSLRADLPIVFGGPLATVIPEVLITSPLVDFVVVGQGEPTMCELVGNLLTGGGRVSRKVGPKFEDKNCFPAYPWELIPVEKYLRRDALLGNRVLNFVSSQGCPHKCGYCSESASYNCRWTALNALRLTKEIIDLKRRFDIDGVKFYDANFFVNQKRVDDFASGIMDLGLHWGASAHPLGVIRCSDSLEKIKASGLNRLLVGAESGSPTVLKHINKGCTVEDNLKAAELCSRFQIPTTFTFVVGFPGIENEIKATIEMIFEIKRMWSEFDVKIHFYAPFPGAPLYEESVKLGYVPPRELEGWSEYDYYFIQTPWVKRSEESNVRNFSNFFCDLLYPSQGMLESWQKNALLKGAFRISRGIGQIRKFFNFYRLPLEREVLRILSDESIKRKGNRSENKS